MKRAQAEEDKKREEGDRNREVQASKRRQDEDSRNAADKLKKKEQKEMKEAMAKAREDQKNLAKKGTRVEKVSEQDRADSQKLDDFEEKCETLVNDPKGKVQKLVDDVEELLGSDELRTVKPCGRLLQQMLRFCREKTETFWANEKPAFDELLEKQEEEMSEKEELSESLKRKLRAEHAAKRAERSTKHDESVIDTIKRFAPLFECLIEQAQIRKIHRFKVMLLSECQRLAHEMGLPRLSPSSALLEVFFDGLYQAEIVEEGYFKLWAENEKDETPGKVQAMFQVNIFIEWLASARVEGDESSDEEDQARVCPQGHPMAKDDRSANFCDMCGGEGTAFRCDECDYDVCQECREGKNKDSDDEASDDEDESDDDIMANVPKSRGR